MIILLNGTSSSGKSSLAEALRKTLPEPYFLFGIDNFLEKSLPLGLNFDNEDDFQHVNTGISAFHEALGAMAAHIPFMVVDHVLHSKAWFNAVANALAGWPTYVVQVKASLKTIEERESARKDRKPGTARAQYDIVYSLPYDLTVDTDLYTPDHCSKHVQKHLCTGTALMRDKSK